MVKTKLLLTLYWLLLTFCSCTPKLSKRVDNYLKSGEYTKAIEIIDKRLKKNPQNSKLIRLKLEVFLKINLPDSALNEYENLQGEDFELLNDICFSWLDKRLTDKDALVQISAAKLLAQSEREEGIKVLIESLNSGRSRVAAVEAIAEAGTNEAIPALKRALKTRDLHLKLAIGISLVKLGDSSGVSAIIEVLERGGWMLRSEAAEALGQFTPESSSGDDLRFTIIPALLEALKDDKDIVRLSAASSLAKLKSKEAIPELEKMFEEDEWAIKMTAAKALVMLGEESLIEIFKAALKMEDKDVRYGAAILLSETGDTSTIPVLREILRQGKISQKVKAISALSSFKNKEYIPDFEELLSNRSVTIRKRTISALEEIKAASSIMECLADKDRTVRLAAIQSLGNTGNTTVVPLLRKELKGKDTLISTYAAGAIIKIIKYQEN
jgi:HEAT repeat protein